MRMSKESNFEYSKEALMELVEQMKQTKDLIPFYDSPDPQTRKEIGKVSHVWIEPNKNQLCYEIELDNGKIIQGETI